VGAREEILARVRASMPPAQPLPPELSAGAQYDDPRAQFVKSLASVGGASLDVRGPIEDALASLPAYGAARSIASLVPGVKRANFDLGAVTDPHQARDVDFCVLPGELGVAESGAIWITNHGGIARSVAFLAQHLAIVLPATSIVHNLHEAYRRIAIPRPGFGVFISGPSKTADIEQSLVIGAHGARSCIVLITPAP
jgi:L-lactate dehydrogenase complex protein LldG